MFSKPNISQDIVLAKLKTYLTQQKRNSAFIAKIMQGYCSGLCTVAAYSQWLALQPSTSDEQGKPKPRDDWPWMESVLTMLSLWDEYSLFTKEQQIDIERLVSLIEYFQNIAQYTKTPQGELQESLKDTRERRLTKTYTLAGVFTIKDLRALLLTPQDNTLLLIESHDHMISILEQNNQYYYYNANDTHGRQIYDKNQLNDLLIKIAGAMDATTIDTPLLLALRFFSFTPQTFNTQILPSPEAFLASLPDYHQRITGVHNQADQYTAIYIAAEIGCLASLTFHLNQHPEMINDKSPDGYTPAFIAADLGNIEALCILAKYGANLNVALLNGATPAFIAAQQGQSSVFRFLCEQQADITSGIKANISILLSIAKDRGKEAELKQLLTQRFKEPLPDTIANVTPLHIAALCGHTEIVQLLLSHHANANATAEGGLTALDLANIMGHSQIISLLENDVPAKKYRR